MSMNERCHELTALYHIGNISDEEFVELESILKESAEDRVFFHRTCRIDAQLQRQVGEFQGDMLADGVQDAVESKRSRTSRVIHSTWLNAGIAAGFVGMLVVFMWSWFSRPELIATVISSENASWQSALPTEVGSDLTRGELKLISGIATIRFHSGAEVILEGASTLELESSMRASLKSGIAMIDVPESAIGFILETRDGYAVDYGTRFAVRIDKVTGESNFEVIEGEIGVHHSKRGDEVRLKGQGKAAMVTGNSLIPFDTADEELALKQAPEVIRIGTRGKATSVLRTNKRAKYIHPDRLTVKKTDRGKWDHRSFFAFDLSGVDQGAVKSARLRLNLIPSTRGFASRLPKINRFGVYGVTAQSMTDWKTDCLWEEAPDPNDGKLIGTFEIPRSIQHGSFGIENEELLKFLQENRNKSVTFILVRETAQIEGNVPGLTHAFASDSHPQAVGPTLEFLLKK